MKKAAAPATRTSVTKSSAPSPSVSSASKPTSVVKRLPSPPVVAAAAPVSAPPASMGQSRSSTANSQQPAFHDLSESNRAAGPSRSRMTSSRATGKMAADPEAGMFGPSPTAELSEGKSRPLSLPSARTESEVISQSYGDQSEIYQEPDTYRNVMPKAAKMPVSKKAAPPSKGKKKSVAREVEAEVEQPNKFPVQSVMGAPPAGKSGPLPRKVAYPVSEDEEEVDNTEAERIRISREASVSSAEPSIGDNEISWGRALVKEKAEKKRTDDELNEWYRTYRFEKFSFQLREMGVERLEDLHDVGPKELESIGATVIEQKRFARALASMRSAGASAASVAAAAAAAGTTVVQPEDLEVGVVIGQGSYGVVHAATWRTTRVAVKILRASLTDESLERAQAEITEELVLMRKVGNHPNVVSLLGICSLQYPPRLCIVTQLMEKGSLLTVLKRESPSLAKLTSMAAQIAAGVTHLHGQGVVHRDLAARNVLVDQFDCVRVGDFGYSRILSDQVAVGVTASVIGPVRWMAPESLSKHEYSPASDVWAFGVVLFEMITGGQEPWAGETLAMAGAKTIRGETLVSQLPAGTDATWTALMTTCWAFEPSARPTMGELFKQLNGYATTLGSSPNGLALDGPVSEASDYDHFTEGSTRRK